MTSNGEGSPLRVVVADDQTAVREGLVTMLDLLPDIAVVGAAADGAQALDLVGKHQPDAALVDLHMPVLDGIELTRQLTTDHPHVAVIVLTTYADDSSIVAALRAGARGYLTKDANRADIARALHAAAAGQSVLDDTAKRALLHLADGESSQPSKTWGDALPDGLTSREGEILLLITRGLSNPQIADSLYLSRHTVKTHINHIFSKTGSRSRDEVIRYANEHLTGE
jgi:DNA-binding NarL/FixJ family response regulator